MSKRKGLSLEEKRQRMTQLFFEKKDFFQLKELEKLGPKEKGVIAQSVKDVVQSLVDDGIVDTDKIGTCVYFWAFPSKATNTRKRKIADINTRLADSEKKRKSMKEMITKAKLGREDSDERTDILKELAEQNAEKDHLLAELNKYKECDPEVLKEVANHTQIAKEAVNRWTDNIFSLKSWCKNKFFIEEDIINKQFNIPEDLDYVD